MFGRIGNFIGGELYGRQVQDPDYPFGMIFQHDPLGFSSPSVTDLSERSVEGLILFIILVVV